MRNESEKELALNGASESKAKGINLTLCSQVE
jgi:hypothetical protein